MKTVVSLALPFLLLLAFNSTVTFSQVPPKNLHYTEKNIKVVASKPSVYVSFREYTKYSNPTSEKTYQVAWFELHNNLKMPISFCTYDNSVSPTGKPGVHYQIEKDLDLTSPATRNNESVPFGFPPYDFCDSYSLQGGKYFFFGVPRGDLIKGVHIKVQYFYPWEPVDKPSLGPEPSHYVEFRSLDLPNK